jgi:hypothetical protein
VHVGVRQERVDVRTPPLVPLQHRPGRSPGPGPRDRDLHPPQTGQHLPTVPPVAMVPPAINPGIPLGPDQGFQLLLQEQFQAGADRAP